MKEIEYTANVTYYNGLPSIDKHGYVSYVGTFEAIQRKLAGLASNVEIVIRQVTITMPSGAGIIKAL